MNDNGRKDFEEWWETAMGPNHLTASVVELIKAKSLKAFETAWDRRPTGQVDFEKVVTRDQLAVIILGALCDHEDLRKESDDYPDEDEYIADRIFSVTRLKTAVPAESVNAELVETATNVLSMLKEAKQITQHEDGPMVEWYGSSDDWFLPIYALEKALTKALANLPAPTVNREVAKWIAVELDPEDKAWDAWEIWEGDSPVSTMVIGKKNAMSIVNDHNRMEANHG